MQYPVVVPEFNPVRCACEFTQPVHRHTRRSSGGAPKSTGGVGQGANLLPLRALHKMVRTLGLTRSRIPYMIGTERLSISPAWPQVCAFASGSRDVVAGFAENKTDSFEAVIRAALDRSRHGVTALWQSVCLSTRHIRRRPGLSFLVAIDSTSTTSSRRPRSNR